MTKVTLVISQFSQKSKMFNGQGWAQRTVDLMVPSEVVNQEFLIHHLHVVKVPSAIIEAVLVDGQHGVARSIDATNNHHRRNDHKEVPSN